MSDRIYRGETRDFSLILDLPEGEYLSDDYDVILMVKQFMIDPNEAAVITKRLRGEGANLVLDSPSGPDPESGEGNVAVIAGRFDDADTGGLFTGFNAEADELHYHLEAGIIDPDGIYRAKIRTEFVVVNSLIHTPL